MFNLNLVNNWSSANDSNRKEIAVNKKISTISLNKVMSNYFSSSESITLSQEVIDFIDKVGTDKVSPG